MLKNITVTTRHNILNNLKNKQPNEMPAIALHLFKLMSENTLIGA